MEPTALLYPHRITLPTPPPREILPLFFTRREKCPRLSSFGIRKPAMVEEMRAKPRTTVVEATAAAAGAPLPPLDLTEDNIRQVLSDARVELAQLFDTSVGITGEVELSELDGPFVKISLKGRFWHKRSTVLARLANYLKQRIPEILEVDIEDEKQLDDSPENF